ncbi:MAG: hypothetical protein ACTSV2_03620 [Candidatus Thorarchaeota archaeon]
MQTELLQLMVANLYFAAIWTPGIVVLVTLIRGVVLFRGRKREFEDWTRNPLMTVLSFVFLPGTLIYIGVRYVVTRIAGIKVDQVGGSTTYGELNMFLNIERPPRVGIVVVSLYVTVILTVFIALTLLVLPFVMMWGFSYVAICWYISIGVFYNSSFRSGDASLVLSALKKRPRTGSIELLVVASSIIFLNLYLMGVIVL